jgi:uncharacterized repeat protein (TIGR04076 family)
VTALARSAEERVGGENIVARRRNKPHDDSFVLYDLKVEVVGSDRPMICNHKAGDYFELKGENLSFPPGQTFALYPLAALLPLLPAKQRVTHANDWMTTDTDIACPDPNCGGRFRITRTGVSTFRHGDVTAVPLPSVRAASGRRASSVAISRRPRRSRRRGA